jgi:hypothetical protein
VLAPRFGGLPDAHAPDVHERGGSQHANDVLDGPEANHVVRHRAGHVFPGRHRERAEEEIQQQADQHLDVDADHKPAPGGIIDWSPGALRESSDAERANA